MTVLAAARALHAAGLCVLPAAADGSKMPAVQWREFQHSRPSLDQLNGWFGSGRHRGLGVVCGAVSGGLEMLELEGRAIEEGLLGQLTAAASVNGLVDLWQRVISGYMERTPSGGLHLLYRVHGGPPKGNTKLARRPATAAELAEKPKDRFKVWIETRGEGGWTVTAPSNGATHSTGRPWVLLAGGPDSIPTLTVAERDALHALAGTLDAMPAAPPPVTPPARPVTGLDFGGSVRPGDDFNARADWADILGPLGWTVAKQNGLYREWRRPGKDTPGISATTGRDGDDRLYVFSSATDFEVEKPYDKLGAVALLEHGGDISKTAAALKAAGYGSRPAPSNGAGPVPPAGGPPAPPAGDPPATPPTAYGSLYSLTDDGNARRLVDAHGAEIRYVPERGQWLQWNRYRWTWDETDAVVFATRELMHNLEPEDNDALAKHRIRSLSRNSIENAVKLARSDPRVVVPMRRLDADPEALCTPGGVVDLRTGAITSPDPSNLHTKAAPIAPDFAMPTPMWNRFLADTFEGKRHMIDYMQRLAGYSATGRTHVHVFPFLHGQGQNGKSELIKVITGLLGPYGGPVAKTLMIKTYGEQHPTEVADLMGLRLGVVAEVSRFDKFDEEKMKTLTGGDELKARYMHGNFFNFQPSHKLWMHANDQPAVEAGGPSFWRRLRLIPFNHRVPEADKIDDIARVLIAAEGPGILAWIIRGAADMLAGGLRDPSEVMDATQQYALEEDALGRFLDDDRWHHAPGSEAVRIETSRFRREYESWCRAEGEHPLTTQALGRQLRNRHRIAGKRSNGKGYYLGLALLSTDDDHQEPTE